MTLLYWSDISFKDDFWEASSLCFLNSFSTASYLEHCNFNSFSCGDIFFIHLLSTVMQLAIAHAAALCTILLYYRQRVQCSCFYKQLVQCSLLFQQAAGTVSLLFLEAVSAVLPDHVGSCMPLQFSLLFQHSAGGVFCVIPSVSWCSAFWSCAQLVQCSVFFLQAAGAVFSVVSTGRWCSVL